MKLPVKRIAPACSSRSSHSCRRAAPQARVRSASSRAYSRTRRSIRRWRRRCSIFVAIESGRPSRPVEPAIVAPIHVGETRDLETAEKTGRVCTQCIERGGIVAQAHIRDDAARAAGQFNVAAAGFNQISAGDHCAAIMTTWSTQLPRLLMISSTVGKSDASKVTWSRESGRRL